MNMLKPILVIMRKDAVYKGYDCVNSNEAFAVAGNRVLGDLAAVYQLQTNKFVHVEFAERIDTEEISEVIANFKHPVEIQ